MESTDILGKRSSARLAAVALQTLGRGPIPDDIALTGRSGVWTRAGRTFSAESAILEGHTPV